MPPDTNPTAPVTIRSPTPRPGRTTKQPRGEWASPPFVLLLDSPEYDEELQGADRVGRRRPRAGYLAEPSADARWCHLWFEHPVAVARLHACWLAWQELTGQQAPGRAAA
ncbi:DUF4913 domain-containing protein [Streptomyces massasporeus]|uniref:DUF4913 domain-containing protein n=1 Tax=Streptomyces massasporeus TaxID=67324 RepID=UPI00370346E9